MKIKKPPFTQYELGVIAILEGGGRIDVERLPSDLWEGLMHDVNGEYFGMVPNGTIRKLVRMAKIKCEFESPDLQTYVAINLVNG